MLYTCDKCGSSMTYDPERKCLVCPHCGNTYRHIPDDRKLEKKICPSCGAPLEKAEKALVYQCPYCGTWMSIDENLNAEDAPTSIRPFSYGKKKARQSILEAFDNIPFLPKGFLADSEGKDIEAVYVPFWIYQASATTDYVFEGKNRTEMYDETRVSVYNLFCTYKSTYKNVPIDAKDEIENGTIDAAIAIDAGEMRSMNAVYLSGTKAELPDKKADEEEYQKRAEDWVGYSEKYSEEAEPKGYDELSVIRQETTVKAEPENAECVLLPVYRYNYKGTGDHKIYMDGTTGRMSGDAPCDKGRVLLHYIFEALCVAVTAVSLIGFIGVLV